ncbi:Cna B-type domain-containing protein, partial [Peptoniphilus grossensis]|uniref:Cna B-type domain-containing protein n=1 Tax=Peptoniphilus grossensis TaxID=1465756 RepID=UPI003994A58C
MRRGLCKRIIAWVLLIVMLVGEMPYGVMARSGTDLKEFLTKVVLTDDKGKQIPEEGGKLKIEKGDTYKLSMTFAEKAGNQFSNDKELTYTIPKGLEMVGGGTKNFDISVTYSDAGGAPQTVTVTNNTYEIENGILTVKFNSQDPNYGKLTGSDNVTFTINNDFKVTEEITEIAFSDKIVKNTYVVDKKPDDDPSGPPTPPEDKKPSFKISLSSKYGREENKAGKVKFTLNISANNQDKDLTNVRIGDLQLGEVLSLDKDSFVVKGTYGGEVSNHSLTFTDEGNRTTGFKINFPSIKKDQTTSITVEFTATVDYDKIHGKEATKEQTLNKASATCDEAETVKEAETYKTIPYFDLELIYPEDEEEERDKKNTIWRDYGDGTTCPNFWPFNHFQVKVNEFFHRDMANAKIHGSFNTNHSSKTGGTSAFGFKGENLPVKIKGLKIIGRDQDGVIRKDYIVPIENIEMKEAEPGAYQWFYTFPEDAGRYYYEVDYEWYPISLLWYKKYLSSQESVTVDRTNADKSVDGAQFAYQDIYIDNVEKSKDDTSITVKKPQMDWENWRLNWESIISLPSCYELNLAKISYAFRHNLPSIAGKRDRILENTIKVYEEVKDGNESTWKPIDPNKEKFEFDYSSYSESNEISFKYQDHQGNWKSGLYPKPGKHHYKITFQTDFNDYLGHNFIDMYNYEDHGVDAYFKYGNIQARDLYDKEGLENGNFFRYYPERMSLRTDNYDWSYSSFLMTGGRLYIQNFPTDQPRDIAISLDKEVFELGKDKDGKFQMLLRGGISLNGTGYSTEDVPVDVEETGDGYVAHIKNWPTTWKTAPPNGENPSYYYLRFPYKIKKNPNDEKLYVDEFYKKALEDPDGKVYLKSVASTPSEKWKLDPRQSRSETIISNELVKEKTYKAQTKTVSTQKDANGNTIANYKLIVNQSGTDYLPEDDFLILEDTMSSNMSLVYGSLKFHNIKTGKDDNLKWTYDSAKKVLKANIPDGVPYEVTYTCLITGTGKQKLSNTATISGQGKVTSTTTETVSSDTTGSATIPFITIQKVDKDAYQIPLKGAEFKLYEKVGSDWKSVQKDGADVANYITDDSGKAIIVADQDKDGWALQYDKEYAVKEVTPPEGYYKNNDYHPFTLKKEPTEGSNFYTLGQIKIIEDEMITCPYNLSATKILKDTNGKAATLSDGSFSFQLDVAKTDDANINLSTLKFEPVEVLKNKADGSIASSLKLRGIGTHVLKLREIIPEKVEEGDKYDKSVYYLVVKVVKDTSVKEGLKVESAKMYKGDLNTSVDKFEFTNTIGKIRSIDVEKIWQNLPDDANKPEVTVKLLKDGVETDQVLKLNNQSWTGTFSNLPRFKDDGTEIAYTVKEVGEDNGLIKIGEKEYNVVVTGNASSGFKITNMPKVENISLKASKVWAAEEGAKLPEVKPTVTFDLYADNVKLEGQSKEITNGQSEITWNLPKTNDNGTEIVYTVKEAGEENGTITLAGKEYTVTTSGNAKEGFTIANTIKKIVPETVALKASKVWEAEKDATLPDTKPTVTFDLYADGVKLDNESRTIANGQSQVT